MRAFFTRQPCWLILVLLGSCSLAGIAARPPHHRQRAQPAARPNIQKEVSLSMTPPFQHLVLVPARDKVPAYRPDGSRVLLRATEHLRQVQRGTGYSGFCLGHWAVGQTDKPETVYVRLTDLRDGDALLSQAEQAFLQSMDNSKEAFRQQLMWYFPGSALALALPVLGLALYVRRVRPQKVGFLKGWSTPI